MRGNARLLEERSLLVTPEIIVLDLADAALVALRRAILVEHPALSAPASSDEDLLRPALRVLKATARLRRALRHYRLAVEQELAHPGHNDLPF